MLVVSNIAELVRRSKPLGFRPHDRQPGRRQYVDEGLRNRSRRARGVRGLGEGIGSRSRVDQGAGISGARLDDLRLLQERDEMSDERCSSTSAIARSPRTRRAPRSRRFHGIQRAAFVNRTRRAARARPRGQSAQRMTFRVDRMWRRDREQRLIEGRGAFEASAQWRMYSSISSSDISSRS